MGGGIIIIEDDCCIEPGCSFAVYDSILRLGKRCRLSGASQLSCTNNSIFDVDDDCSIGPQFLARVHAYANVYMGKDCMLSTNILLRAGNGHNIYDLENKENRELYLTREINVGEHVWIGEKSVLLHGASIGNGSIVGTNSFVNKKYPENVTLAGNPARIIRKNISWNRCGDLYLMDEDAFREFDYRTD